jgi:oligo-1,6-glucosidase
MNKKWWMESVGYQIYPKSFYDTNDDGIGDLPGILEKLDYLKTLGVNLIWICPFYDSPMDDNGYDVRDFFGVSKVFGTMDDVKKIIEKAHDYGMRIVMDYVLNHTSDEHPWFIESKSSKDNPYRDYYIWSEGKIVDGIQMEPTNWGSFFGGSAWNYDETTDSYYMKIFSNKMPDLNWKNPSVRSEMAQVAQKWLDLGIDGFRIDAVSHLDKAPFIDAEAKPGEKYPLDYFKFSNQPMIHPYLKELYQNVFSSYDCVTIGEVGGSASIEEGIRYSAYDSNELSMVFSFDHNWCNNIFEINHPKYLKTDVIKLKQAFNMWQTSMKNIGWVPLVWFNHDQPRLISHYGSKKFPLQSGKMLATALHMMRGTPFIYQGEEIGMTNYPFEDVTDFNDISSISSYQHHLNLAPDDPVTALRIASMRSRDNARTPMQWTSGFYAGFSNIKPWMNVNPNYRKVNVERNLKDPNSLFYHYQKLIALRKDSPYRDVILWGDYELKDPLDEKHYTYTRTYQDITLLVINSFSNSKTSYDLSSYVIKDILIHNEKKIKMKDQKILLRPYESIVFVVKEKS